MAATTAWSAISAPAGSITTGTLWITGGSGSLLSAGGGRGGIVDVHALGDARFAGHRIAVVHYEYVWPLKTDVLKQVLASSKRAACAHSPSLVARVTPSSSAIAGSSGDRRARRTHASSACAPRGCLVT